VVLVGWKVVVGKPELEVVVGWKLVVVGEWDPELVEVLVLVLVDDVTWAINI
jgi:hypothetical protein